MSEITDKPNGFTLLTGFALLGHGEDAPLTETERTTSAHRGYIPLTHLDVFAPAMRRGLPATDEAIAQMIRHFGIPEIPFGKNLVKLGIPKPTYRENLMRAIYYDMTQQCDCCDEWEYATLASQSGEHKSWPHVIAELKRLWRTSTEGERKVVKATYLAIYEKLQLLLPKWSKEVPGLIFTARG